MKIKVTHPSGHVEEFDEGTDAETINKRMSQIDAQIKKKQDWETNRQNMSWADTAKDVAKSAGVGAAQGAIGLATAIPTVADLGARVVDYAGSKIGHNPELSQYTENLPTYENTKNYIEDNLTGKFYEPKSRLGQYARTVGEFAPTGGAIGAVSKGSRLAKTLIPALTSETAGQLTEGTKYEPAARVVGALTGGMLPNTAMRAVTPMRADPTRQAALQTLEREGVTSLTAGDRTGNRFLQWSEDVSRDMPFNGGKVGAVKEAQEREFTRAALRRVGEDADLASPEVINRAFNRLGNEFNTIIGNNAIRVDNQLNQDIRNTVTSYFRQKNATARVPAIEETARDVIQAIQNPQLGGRFSGEAYQSTRKELENVERANRFQDPTTAQAARQLREALDDAFTRSVSPDIAESLQTARDQYRELLAIEQAVGKSTQKAAEEIITPKNLAQALLKQDRRGYVRGSREQAELARAGQRLLTPLQQSGTAPRANAQTFLNTLGAATGGIFGSAGGPVGTGIGAAAGAMGQAMAQGAMARTLMSKPVQNYLSNQTLAPAIEYYNNALRPSLANTAIPAAMLANEPYEGRSFSLYNR